MTTPRLVVAGSGFAGLVAALAADDLGIDTVVIEKGMLVGGATALSGGQVWVAGNHVAARLGIDDDIASGIAYVRALTASHPDLLDEAVMREWIDTAPAAARWLEDLGVLTWEIIPGFPDYHYPALSGTRPEGRYLTPAPFDGRRLGDLRTLLPPPVHFPSGVTYGELFAWGGQASRRNWDQALLAERRAHDVLTFGQALAAALLAALADRGVPVHTEAEVVSLVAEDGAVVGARVRRGGTERIESGAVMLATGSYDSDPELAERYSGTPAPYAGSVAPNTLTGDALRVAAEVGAEVRAHPAESAARLPGFRLTPTFPGDTGDRQCHEHGLPHAIVVDRRGHRFCDDAFPSAITEAVLGQRGPGGEYAHLPFFMVWDDRHRRRYGLAEVPPGGDYPPGTVTSAGSLAELAAGLGIDPDGLRQTVARYNEHADRGEDPDFARGARPWSQKFKGDAEHAPHPNIGTIEEAPFHGIELRLAMTGIPAAGLVLLTDSRVSDSAGEAIPGLYAAGSSTAMTNSGAGYNSGFSLSRGLTGGLLAARHVASLARPH
jgi:3-oxosteroid 1-dehydrogenase